MNNTLKQPIITTTLAAGSTASPYTLLCNITQQLCYKACAEQQAVFAPSFSLKQVTSLGSNSYVATIAVQGIISYARCGSTDCSCAVQQPLTATFNIPFVSTTAPTAVTVAAEQPIVTIAATQCSQLSRTLVAECILTLTIA